MPNRGNPAWQGGAAQPVETRQDDAPGITRRELERIIDERIAARLEEEDRSSIETSRRGLLGLAGAATGIGLFTSSASASASETGGGTNRPAPKTDVASSDVASSDVATADELRADAIHAGSTLTVNGQQLSVATRTQQSSDVITVSDASNIQSAIDELAESEDGDATGGVVQLEAKTYYPTTTIWLKRGVTLQGVRPAGYEANPYGDDFVGGTVISTRDLAEGPGALDPSKGANTYSHSDPNGENWHPHFPVVANFRTKPYHLQNRNPTNYEADYWGHHVGLRNVVIDGSDKQRWWDDGSRDATYFGVYDGVIFEHVRNALVENVTTRGLLGYGGFFNGCRGLIDRGSRWVGGATDYHGAALETNIGYPPDPKVYTEGTWDVDVQGPPPTLKLEGHNPHRFTSAGWSQATIEATERSNHTWEFLGSESDYWDGNAPITDPDNGRAVVTHTNCQTTIEGYGIDASEPDNCDGVRVVDSNMTLRNVSVSGGRRGINHTGKNPLEIVDSAVSDCDLGLRCRVNAPRINGLVLSDCREGINFSGRANHDSVMDDVVFHDDVDVAFGSANRRPIYMGTVYFGGADSAGQTGEYLKIDHPVDPDGIY